MEIIKTDLEGLLVVKINIFNDERGFFCERYNREKFVEKGIANNFIQDNHSSSKPGVIRGLHFQKNPDQAKLVSCIKGKILDVAVDIRKNSSTFGQHFAIELSPESGLSLFVPAGFAHGFSVLGDDEAEVTYKVDGHWNAAGEGGILCTDEDLGIDWKVKTPIISEKDKKLPLFSNYLTKAVF